MEEIYLNDMIYDCSGDVPNLKKTPKFDRTLFPLTKLNLQSTKVPFLSSYNNIQQLDFIQTFRHSTHKPLHTPSSNCVAKL